MVDDQKILAVFKRRCDELVAAIDESRTEARRGFDRMEERMNRHSERVDGGTASRPDPQASTTDGFKGREARGFNRLESALAQLHRGLDSLEDSVYDLAERITCLSEKLDRQHDQRVADWDRNLDELRADLLFPTGGAQRLIADDDRSGPFDA